VLVVVLDKLADLALEVCDRVKGGAADRLIGDQRKPTLDLIEPGAVGRGEVQMKARPPCQPGTHFGVLVRAVVVADQVNIEVFRNVGLDMAKEGKKLLVPVPLLALGEDAAVGHIKRRKQCRRSVADVVMGDAFDIPQAHRQDRLRALKRLHLTLLIDAQAKAFCGGLR